jgi:hypothetical protein
VTLGIVGHEAAKFTAASEQVVRSAIRLRLHEADVDRVVSGACPLGGVDVWAIQEAEALGIETQEFPPANSRWEPDGFKARNIQIAEAADLVICYVVDRLPAAYTGRRFEFCYHCVRRTGGGIDHVKSGGCWTLNHALGLGKDGAVVIIRQQP